MRYRLEQLKKVEREEETPIKEKDKESKVILEAVENLKEKQRAHVDIEKKA